MYSKRKRLLDIGLLLSIVIFLSSCSAGSKHIEAPITQILPTESLETVYGCTNVSFLLSIATTTYSDYFILINDQEGFNRLHLNPSCSPEIDFNKYSLLIGTKGLTRGCSSIDYQLKKITTGTKDSLFLNVTFQLNDATVAPIVTWNVLMPRQPEGIPVKVNFEMKE
ncbi:MAG TPA: hypothetical protein PKE30_09155 [Niabella sp.]|nr:hypothetical protein [Niabella sp.]